jgi:hypothetical protein
MAEKKTIELDIQSNLGSLRSQLKEAQADVAAMADKFGATSKQAQDAAKKAAKLKDAIGDAKDLTDAFNPDAKFGALTKSLSGAMDGFQAVQGAMGMFGAESADVEKALLKVQSAMAMAQGVQGVMESVDSFKTLITQVKGFTIVQKISTALQWLWNTAMEANPVMAIATAIIAVLAVGYKLISWLMDSSEANEEAAAATKRNTEALNRQKAAADKAGDSLKEKNSHEYNMAKAAGASAEALRKLALKHADEQIALEEASVATARNTYEKQRNILESYKMAGMSDEVIEKQRELVTKTREALKEEYADLKEAYKHKRDVIYQNQVEIQQEITDAKNKEIQAEKEKNDKIKEQQQDAHDKAVDQYKDNEQKKQDLIKQYNENLIAYLDSKEKERQAKITDAQEKELQDVDNKYEALYAQADAANQSDKDIIIAHQEEIQAIKDKYAKIALDKLAEANREAEKLRIAAAKEMEDKILEIDEQNFQNRLKKSMTEEEYELELVRQKYFTLETLAEGNAEQLAIIEQAKANEIDAIQKKQSDKEKELSKNKNEMVLKGIKDSLQMISDLNTLFAGKSKKQQEKAFKVQKAVNIANAVVDTYKAANAALASSPPPFNFIAMGAAITAGLINVKKITDTKFDGGATPPAGGGGGTGGGAGSVMSPSFNIVGNSGINQLAQLQQKPSKAYVVSGDVTSAQSLDRNRIENATLVQ